MAEDKVITGRVRCEFMGQVLLNKGGTKLNGLGSDEREQIQGDNEIIGYITKPTEKSCEIPLSDRSDVDIEALCNKGPGTLQVIAIDDGGKQFTLLDAICTGNISMTTGEGEMPVKFVGSRWK